MDPNSLRDFIVKEVPDWDDEVVASARFKAFSGQRSDWEPKFRFWRDLIIKVARYSGLFIIRPSEVKNVWFNRGGLTPLCIDHVLSLMCDEGDIVRSVDLVELTSGRISQLFRKVRNIMLRTSTPDVVCEDYVILTTLLKDKVAEVAKVLSASHWTSSCIVPMKKFQDLCGGPQEASVILRYLSECGKAQYLSVHKKELVEGVKISLSTEVISSISNLDYDVLHLIWTTEKLQQQLDVIDRRYELSRKSALDALQFGNRKLALRYARELKLNSDSREKCSTLLSRVEEVLGIIADAESTKKVSEAMQIGARAIRENKISVEEVDLCLSDLQESIDSQKEVQKAIEQTPSYTDIEEEDIQEEFEKLELAVGKQHKVPMTEITSVEGKEGPEAPDFISDALSNLKLSDGPARKPNVRHLASTGDRELKNIAMDAA